MPVRSFPCAVISGTNLSCSVRRAKLLKARKKSAPSKEWMKQLPHKARVLEDRLYRKASSLEAYLNRSTLKNRLRTLAVTITAHYKNSVKTKKGSRRGQPATSGGSKHDSVARSSSPQDSLDAPLMALAGHSLDKEDSPLGPMIVPPIASPVPSRDDGEVLPPEVAMNELARQKQVNEELQKQILENIRQQQQLVHSIRRGSNGSEINTGMNPNNPSANFQGRDMTGGVMAELRSNSSQGTRQRKNMAPSDLNDAQSSQFSSSMARSGSASSAMVHPPFEAQTSMARQGSGFNAAQIALMQKQSSSMPGSSINIQHKNMQAEMMIRNSSAGPQGLGSAASQAQFQAQQDAMMMQTQMQNQAAQAQMQAMMSANSNPFNMAQAAMMAGGIQMNPQAQMALMQQMSANQMNNHPGNPQSEFMRRTSLGNNPNIPSGTAAMMGYPGMMNTAMGGNDPMMGAFTNNQQMAQNAAMMQSMNGMGMPQNMTQFAGAQQQNFMSMGNPMMGVGNDGNFPNNTTFQGNKGGGNMGLESQNSFSW
jgi:hypothetical protein